MRGVAEPNYLGFRPVVFVLLPFLRLCLLLIFLRARLVRTSAAPGCGRQGARQHCRHGRGTKRRKDTLGVGGDGAAEAGGRSRGGGGGAFSRAPGEQRAERLGASHPCRFEFSVRFFAMFWCGRVGRNI